MWAGQAVWEEQSLTEPSLKFTKTVDEITKPAEKMCGQWNIHDIRGQLHSENHEIRCKVTDH